MPFNKSNWQDSRFSDKIKDVDVKRRTSGMLYKNIQTRESGWQEYHKYGDPLTNGELWDFDFRSNSHLGNFPEKNNSTFVDEDNTGFPARTNFNASVAMFRKIGNQMPNNDDWTSYQSKSAGTTVTREYLSDYGKEVTKVVMTAANNSIYQRYAHDPDGETWTASFTLYTESAMDIWIEVTHSGSVFNSKSEKFSLSIGYNHISSTYTFADSSGANIDLYLLNYGTANAYGLYADKSGGGAACTFYILDSQFEELPYPSVYAPSSRQKALLGFKDYQLAQQGTIEFWYRPCFKIFGPNLVARHECEEGTEPMVNGEQVANTSAGDTYNRSVVEKHSGSSSFLFTKNSAVGTDAYTTLTNNRLSNDLHNFIAGKKYKFTIWIYTSDAANTLIYFSEYHTAAWHSHTDSPVADNTWEQIEIEVTLNAATTGVYLQVYFDIGAVAGSTMYVDDIEIYRYELNYNKYIISDRDGTDEQLAIYYDESDNKFHADITGATTNVDLVSTSAYTDDTWQDWIHFKYCWDVPNDNYYLYQNGTLIDSDTATDIGTWSPNAKLCIGSDPYVSDPNGYEMDALMCDLLIRDYLDQSNAHYIKNKPWYDPEEMASNSGNVKISPESGLVVKKGETHIEEKTTGHIYCGHLVWFEDLDKYEIYDSAAYPLSTWTDADCIIPSNMDVKGGLFKVYLLGTDGVGRSSATAYVYLRPNGTDWIASPFSNTPASLQSNGMSDTLFTTIQHTGFLACPIGIDNKIEFYSYSYPNANSRRFVISQLGVFI